jgi:type I restriction enzyme M protein
VIKVAYLARLPGLDRAQKKALKSGTFHGIELVDSVTRLCAMNLLLHGIGEPRHLLAEGRRP